MILSRTDVGMVRKINQDAIFASPGLLAVADGMGGHKAGEIASQMAIEEISIFENTFPSQAEAQSIFEVINQYLYNLQNANPNYEGMGTTLTAAWVQKNLVRIAHVGDSRLYLINKKEAKQMTQDHSYVGRLVRDRLITEEQARTNPYRNYIDRALGLEETIEIQFLELTLKKGDILLLCSDGLSSMLPKKEIQDIVLKNTGENILDILFHKTMEAGAPDNISAIVLQYEEEIA